MIVNVHVNPQEATKNEFAMVTLNCESAGLSSTVNINYSTLLDKCDVPNDVSIDFLFISTIIYCIDKLIPRSHSIDNWTRQLQTEIPVADSNLWNDIRDTLNKAISFLTGDLWNISFRELECSLKRPKSDRYRLFIEEAQPETVSLFSGGLDSLIGAIDLLESRPQATIKFVGHYDPSVGGPMSDQNNLMNELRSHYRNRGKFVQIRVGQTPSGDKKASFRSRSILFIGLGIYVASAAGENIELLMPENGNIALNVPLTPSRRGSCSTRTAHPFFLETINQVLEGVGITNRVRNPFEFKTKGECVEQCRNGSLLERVLTDSVSCAKPHHRRTWIRRSARQCGRCMPCIYRRAALHKIGLDSEVFGRDICLGEVELDSTEGLADDFRAYVSFMSNNPTSREISDLLLANGNLDISKLSGYGDVVFRALEEIRSLLRDKATPRVKQQIGMNRI
jgi:large-conductance mechanosensitive channel